MSFARATKAFPLEVPSTRDARESAPPGAVGAGGSSLVAGTSARGHVDKEEAVDDDETDEGAATTKSVDVGGGVLVVIVVVAAADASSCAVTSAAA